MAIGIVHFRYGMIAIICKNDITSIKKSDIMIRRAKKSMLDITEVLNRNQRIIKKN